MREEIEKLGATIDFIRNVRVEVECDNYNEADVRKILSNHSYVVVDSCDYQGKRSLRAM